MKHYLLLLALFATAAQADSTPTARTHYELENLKPLGFSHILQPAPLSFREYLNFQNEEGIHHFIYEESPLSVPLQEIHHVQQAVHQLDYNCSAELDCDTKAFCTDTCKDMYYELSNVMPTTPTVGENHCRIVSFSCNHENKATSAPAMGHAP
jgi:hypothetical protein